MLEADFDEFEQMLGAVCSLLSRGNYEPSAANTALYFRALARFSLSDVRAAFDAHVGDSQRGRYVPTPADLIAQLEAREGADGRPGSEEAWAIAFRSTDESQTVVWTPEIAEALGVAQPLLDARDKVAARKAFIEAYERIIVTARQRRTPVTWSVSEGHDPRERARVVGEAVIAGLIPPHSYEALPAPRGATPLLTMSQGIPDHVRESLLKLREWLTQGGEEEGADAAGKAKTAALKREAAERVRAFGVPIPTQEPVRPFCETEKDES
jgi:hypothetical protein